MKITVIGSSGFMGNRLCQKMNQQGLSCTGLNSKQFNFLDKNTWHNLPKHSDCLVIAAGVISHDSSAFQVNSDPVPFLLEHFRESGTKKIVYLSTGAVYGPHETVIHTNTTCKPDNPYGKSKLLAENCIKDNWKENFNILRLFFPYGLEQKTPRFLPRLIDKIKKSEVIECNPDGGPYLSMTHADDLAKIVLKHFIMQEHPKKIVNIASDFKINIQTLSEILGQGFKIKPHFSFEGTGFNCVSEPFAASEWQKTGNFNEFFA